MKKALLRILPLLLFKLRLFALWQLVPRTLRRRIVARTITLPTRAPHADRPLAPQPPYTVIGFASSHASLGWTMRALLLQLHTEGYEPAVLDVSERFGADHKQTNLAIPDLSAEPGTLIINVNPNQIALALAGCRPEALANKYIIGSFVWELETVPDSWLEPTALVDEIWAPTNFVANAFRKAAPDKPIRLMPYLIEVPESTRPSRSAFDLPEDRFLILMAANVRSGLARKNIVAGMEAFAAAFPDPAAGATLVLKLHDAHLAPKAMAQLAPLVARHAIRLIECDLTDEDMWCLIASCDAILSMHRAEGYGLLLRQGLMLQKPVVATGWSGNVDFMKGDPHAHLVDYRLVPLHDPEGIYEEGKSVWAEPSVTHAATILRGLYDDWLRARHLRT